MSSSTYRSSIRCIFYQLPDRPDRAIIVDVEVTRLIRQAEVGSLHTILDRVKDKFDMDSERIIADIENGSGPILGRLVDRDISLHISVINNAGRNDDAWTSADFEWDAEDDQFL